MRRLLVCRRVAVLALFFTALACSAPEQRCPPSAIGSWSADGEPEVYAGDDLFIYINGGAEIYHEYGFEQVAVSRYVGGDHRISVEIYTMTEAAFGIYSFARSQSGQPVDLADGGMAAEYYVHLWGGKDMAVVTAEDDFDDRRQAALEIAGVVAGCLQSGGAPPELMDRVASAGGPDDTPIYVRGQLAFVNVARPAAAFFSGFEEGVIGSVVSGQGVGSQNLLLRWPDNAVAAAALEDARLRVEATEGAVVHSSTIGAIDFSAGDHRMTAALQDNLVTVTMKWEDR